MRLAVILLIAFSLNQAWADGPMCAQLFSENVSGIETPVSLELEGRALTIPKNRRIQLVAPTSDQLREIEKLAQDPGQGRRRISVNELIAAMKKSPLDFGLNNFNWVRIAARDRLKEFVSNSHHLPEVSGIPRAVFLEDQPTAILPLKTPEKNQGSLWLKDDSRSTRVYGGNKPRKLEYFFGEAVAKGATHVITTGFLGSNHAVATAAMGKEMGFEVVVVLNHQFYTESVKENVRAAKALGAEIVYVDDKQTAVDGIVAALQSAGQHPYVIPAGGKSALGEVGWVNAAYELKSQISTGVIATPKEIWIPVGTGGSAAGLLIGSKLAHMPSRLKFVDVFGTAKKQDILTAAQATLDLLRKHMPIEPSFAVSESDFDLITTAAGEGFGVPLKSAQVESFLKANPVIPSDEVFMNKTIGALLQTDLKLSSPKEPILYWSTFNSQEMELADVESLPSNVRSALEIGQRKATAVGN